MAGLVSPETVARRIARRPWLTVAAWLVVAVVTAVVINTLLDDALTSEEGFISNPESQRAEEMLEARMRGPRQASEMIILRSDTLTVDEPAFRRRVEQVSADLAPLWGSVVAFSTNVYLSGDRSLVSKDRKTTLIPVLMAGSFDQAAKNSERVHEAVKKHNGQDGVEGIITGEATLSQEFSEIAESDLQAGELFGVPVAVVILVLVFGGLAAAVLPVVLAGLSILVALGLAALVGQAFTLSFFVTNMITMIGLAVGIDYSLFIVERYREERRRGLGKEDAIARASQTAGRAVLFSGMTVVLALVGMVIVPTTVFRSLGIGAILVVIVAVAAALTLLPAVLSLLGDRVNALRIPVVGRRQSEPDSERGFWVWIARSVMRRPVPNLLVTVGVLIAASVAYFDIKTGASGVVSLPAGSEARRGFEILENEFSFGLVTPVQIVINGEVGSPAVQGGIQRMKDALRADPTLGEAKLEVNRAGDLGVLSVPIAGDPNSTASVEKVKQLRRDYIPPAFAGVPAEVLVTGGAAFNLDFLTLSSRFTPIVFAFVLALSFLLLMLVFRSLVVPLKAILMNLLSVGAAYGLLVLVFQKGVGTDFLGFQRAEVIEGWIPLFLFSVLFGLSMDYHVFLLSRIRERYDQTRDNAAAVAFGLRSTGRLITGAALIMVAVFAAFASGRLVMFQQVGFGLAVAVLLDATIVRTVLVPASMKLLGNINWYLPKGLHWLPDLRVEPLEQAKTPAGGAE